MYHFPPVKFALVVAAVKVISASGTGRGFGTKFCGSVSASTMVPPVRNSLSPTFTVPLLILKTELNQMNAGGLMLVPLKLVVIDEATCASTDTASTPRNAAD